MTQWTPPGANEMVTARGVVLGIVLALVVWVVLLAVSYGVATLLDSVFAWGTGA